MGLSEIIMDTVAKGISVTFKPDGIHNDNVAAVLRKDQKSIGVVFTVTSMTGADNHDEYFSSRLQRIADQLVSQ